MERRRLTVSVGGDDESLIINSNVVAEVRVVPHRGADQSLQGPLRAGFGRVHVHDALEDVVAVRSDDGVLVGEGHTGRKERCVVQTLVASVFLWAERQIAK